ncbi:MAG TPA: UbiA-like polyprenyltransferase [Tepidisphaeraceae bacterium]|jgi:4-hydroxybenzoate polyprenyltransferase
MTTALPTLPQRLGAFASDIKLSHSVFAMPWAILATFMAARASPGGLPRAGQVVLILICMVLARTVAMAANRVLDARLDAANARTAGRAIPSGRLSVGFVTTMLLLCAAGFIAAAAGFGALYGNWIPLAASLPVLAWLCGYPLMKRFTRWCHYYLGAALALAPICAWVAIAGVVPIEPLLMAGAVLLWTAGFDILYACQDYDVDRASGLFSVPSRFGIARALWIARGTHVVCVALLIALGFASPLLGSIYFVGVAIAAALLIAEHSVVKPNDLSKLNLAFFTFNGIISLTVGALGLIDVFL